MNRRKIMIIGEKEALRRKVSGILNRIPGASGVESETGAFLKDSSDSFSNRRIDAVLLEYADNLEEVMLYIRNQKPGLPVVVYSENPDYRETRTAMHMGARDVVSLKDATCDSLCAVLEDAMNLSSWTDGEKSQMIYQAIENITSRGQYIEKRLLEGNPPPYYMNGNRARLLVGKVLPGKENLLRLHYIVWQWIQEFGESNSFILTSADGSLRLGAIIEQAFINQASFQQMLMNHMERLFERLADMGCICAVTGCVSDYLSLATINKMKKITDQVFYLKESKYLEDRVRRSYVLPSELYASFRSAVVKRETDGALAVMDQAVAQLRANMPEPDFARKCMQRFLWAFVLSSGMAEESNVSLSIEDSSIDGMRNDIGRIIKEISLTKVEHSEDSLMDELINRINQNPGSIGDIDQSAAEVGFSRSHFCRIFRKETGLSFTSYVNNSRLAASKKLLKQTNMTVNEIAEMVGINNPSYFKTLFKKETGVSVEEWRENAE